MTCQSQGHVVFPIVTSVDISLALADRRGKRQRCGLLTHCWRLLLDNRQGDGGYWNLSQIYRDEVMSGICMLDGHLNQILRFQFNAIGALQRAFQHIML